MIWLQVQKKTLKNLLNLDLKYQKNNKNCLQQLGFRCGWKPNNETRVERNRLHAVNSYEVIAKLFEWISRGLNVLFFFCGKSRCFLHFSAPEVCGLSTSPLTHKINFHRNLNFGHRQDTKQVDHAGQKLLSGVNYPFYNTDI